MRDLRLWAMACMYCTCTCECRGPSQQRCPAIFISLIIMASLSAISNIVNISSHVHALSLPTSSNSLKQLIPGSSSKSTHEKGPLLITPASLSTHVRDRSLDSSNKAAQRCRDDEVGLPGNTRPEEKSILNRSVNRLCVFSGSCSAETGIYTHVTLELGTELVQRGITLVYGGGSSRLTGKAAETVKNGGGHVMGVIPQALMQRGLLGDKIADLVTVNDMDRRRWLPQMIRRADAFLALPGGLEALDEVDEMITMSDLGLHKKPVGLRNVNGFYDPIISSWLERKAQRFRSSEQPKDDIMVSAATVPKLLDMLQGYPNTQQLWTAAYK